MKGERITLPVTLPALEERIHITVNGIAFNMIKVDDGTFTGENGAYPPTKSGSIHPLLS